jgi:AraC-like DNA-binding protein
MRYVHRGHPVLPPGRPRWQCPASAKIDLLYLSWGQRFYGRNPLPLCFSPGWPYVLVLEGSPTLLLAKSRISLRTGDFIVLDPDCACGWTDHPEGRFRLLGSVWRSAPRTGRFIPRRGGVLHFHVNTQTFARFEEIHANCRREVRRLDEFTGLAFEELRLSWEVALGRALLGSASPPDSAAQFELAVRWIAEHLQEKKPVELLCEYLQTTISSLNRLFGKHLGESVSNYHHRAKMGKARELLRAGKISGKEIAYSLGYKHANDFSRAFKNFSGQSPTKLLSEEK